MKKWQYGFFFLDYMITPLKNPLPAGIKSHPIERKRFMKYSLAQQGRIFVIRLEDGDIVHEEIEKFAREQSIKAAALIILGGAAENSTLLVGPDQGIETPINPMEHILDNVHEIAVCGLDNAVAIAIRNNRHDITVNSVVLVAGLRVKEQLGQIR